jgi:hypothetical protein
MNPPHCDAGASGGSGGEEVRGRVIVGHPLVNRR